jgi:hypothetical protein
MCRLWSPFLQSARNRRFNEFCKPLGICVPIKNIKPPPASFTFQHRGVF